MGPGGGFYPGSQPGHLDFLPHLDKLTLKIETLRVSLSLIIYLMLMLAARFISRSHLQMDLFSSPALQLFAGRGRRGEVFRWAW